MRTKLLLKLTFLLVAGALVLTSCNAGSPRDFAEKFIAAEKKAWMTGETGDLEAVEDANIKFHLPGAELTGWPAHKDYIVKGRATVPDLKQDWQYLSGEGNHIVLSYAATATVGGLPTTLNYLFVLRLGNGKVVEIWANGTTATDKPAESATQQ